MAQKALFITINELKRKSIIDGNVDADKLIQFIEVAQDTHIQNYLGGKLYTKLQNLIINDEINNWEEENVKANRFNMLSNKNIIRNKMLVTQIIRIY